MGMRLALAVTPANEAERRQISTLAQRVQEVTGASVEALDAAVAHSGEETAAAAQEQGLRWVVERSFAWVSRFRRLARDYERLSATLAELHFAAFIRLLLLKTAQLDRQFIAPSKRALY
jgi:transposase